MNDSMEIDATRGVEVPSSYCTECTDMPSAVYCHVCQDGFCVVCYQSQHRKGKRVHHKIKPLNDSVAEYLAKCDSDSKSAKDAKVGDYLA